MIGAYIITRQRRPIRYPSWHRSI